MARTKKENAQEAVEESVVEGKKAETTKEIPDYVDAVLKLYPEYGQLIVNSFGGAFVPGTPKEMHIDGVLYDNKYFTN